MIGKDVSLSEAKSKLSALVNEVAYGRVRVVIRSHGKPKAALVPFEDLGRLGERGSRSRREALLAAEELGGRLEKKKGSWTPVVKELSSLRLGTRS
jgi:prevent-host-death family protein